MKNKSILLIIILLFSMLSVFSQSIIEEYTCLFYNLENMFHPSDDPLVADNDYTPEGYRHWTYYRYHQKLTQICKVILSSNRWDPPTLLCLCELENRQVLKDIIAHPLLIKTSYEIIHRDSHDHRGIDVAILYRNDKLQCIDTSWLKIKTGNSPYMKTRDILCAKFQLKDDTLLLACNHWTSKYGGALESEGSRMQQARTLGSYIDSSLHSQPGLLVIAGGDMNDASESNPIKELIEISHLQEIFPDNNACTYKYQGIWQSIDHAFIGGNLEVKNCKAQVISNPFLLEKDVKHTGSMPFRTYRGYAYNGGISDHLPLLLHF